MIEETIVEQVVWGDLHLRFASEDEANEVLADYTGSVDAIGVIYKPTGNVDEEGNQEMVALPGWHVNTRGPIELDLQAFAVEVDSPVRVWA